MAFSIFINFDGSCREAVAFYAQAFGRPVPQMMTYGEAPEQPDFPLPGDAKDRILYTSLDIGGTNVMFSDVPPGMEGFVVGTNVSPVVSSTSRDEVRAMFEALKEGGTVEMELQETFFSGLYGMVTDRFGVVWQLDYDDGRAADAM